jgi:putative transposase
VSLCGETTKDHYREEHRDGPGSVCLVGGARCITNADAADRITQAAETIYPALVDAELTTVIGAAPHERTDSRTNQRNGSRPRTLSTIAGDLELRIPKLRSGSFLPALLERRRRVDQCLFAVAMEAYLHSTSTRKVDDLVKALGADSGIAKSEVSRICADLDTEVAAFRDRPLPAHRVRRSGLGNTGRHHHLPVELATVADGGSYRQPAAVLLRCC